MSERKTVRESCPTTSTVVDVVVFEHDCCFCCYRERCEWVDGFVGWFTVHCSNVSCPRPASQSAQSADGATNRTRRNNCTTDRRRRRVHGWLLVCTTIVLVECGLLNLKHVVVVVAAAVDAGRSRAHFLNFPPSREHTAQTASALGRDTLS